MSGEAHLHSRNITAEAVSTTSGSAGPIYGVSIRARWRIVTVDHPLDVDVQRVQACGADHRVLHPAQQ
jgi:hypothetical protein